MIGLILLALMAPAQWQAPEVMTPPRPVAETAPSLASDLNLALCYLTAPIGTPEAVPCEKRWVAVRDAIHQKAIDLEIMDPRETRYLLTIPADWSNDLEILRGRYADLKDAPRLNACHLLPPRHQVNELIKFNRAFRKHIEERMLWEQDRQDLFHEVLAETDAAYRAWDQARDAQCDFYYVTVRRLALKRLQCILPEEDKFTLTMPPYVPHWRFQSK